jgi:anaerobic dimethyl sulfoxide reductase subunit C (anchor subunit)
MNENFTSLVFFTVICQTAVGALIFRWLIILRDGFENAPAGLRKISLLAIAILLILALSIAFFHLGNPKHSLNALNNIGKSWLSREIFSLTFLIATLLLYLIVITKSNPGKSEMVFSGISIIAGISLTYSMIRLYMIPSVITWNSPFTPISFIITTLLCGILFLILMTGKHDERFIGGITLLIAVFIIASFINSLLFQGSFGKQNHNLFIIRTALSVLSLLIVAMIYFGALSNKTFILWVILFVMIFSSEIINRYIFFLSFDKSGL